MKRLQDSRVLVVGASSGIGRATAEALADEGARVVAAARRTDRLQELCGRIDATPVTCDVRQPEQCHSLVARALEVLGGLDALVYASGVARLLRVADAGFEDWRDTLAVNVVGASLVTGAALPALREAHGRAVYLSSITVQDNPPRPGLGLYVTSKAALDRMVEVLQLENPRVAFTRVSVGDTGATEMGVGWDPGQGGEIVREWIARGLMFGRGMEPSDVAHHVADLLASREAIPISTIVPRALHD